MATRKQIAVAKAMSENIGKPIGALMVDAGYSKSTSETPQRLTASKSWQELMDEYLPDEKLQQVHAEGLEATRVVSAVNTGKDASASSNDFIDVPDYAVRKQYLELAYKVKNKVKDKVELTGADGETLKIEIIEDHKDESSTSD